MAPGARTEREGSNRRQYVFRRERKRKGLAMRDTLPLPLPIFLAQQNLHRLVDRDHH